MILMQIYYLCGYRHKQLNFYLKFVIIVTTPAVIQPLFLLRIHQYFLFFLGHYLNEYEIVKQKKMM